MSPSHKLHAFIATSTVAIMYWAIGQLATWFPPDSLHNAWWRAAVVYVGSAAFYQLLVSFLQWLFDYSRCFRRLILGSEYVEGTWIGCYWDANQPRFTIEHFEQDLEGVTIRGYAYTEQSDLHVQWLADAVALNADKGRIAYSYDCTPFHGVKVGHQGVAVFMFQRASRRKAPTRFAGYSADLTDGTRSINEELRISYELIPLSEALEVAKKTFTRTGGSSSAP